MATLTRRPNFVDIPPKRTRSLALNNLPKSHHVDDYVKPLPPSPPRERPVLIPIYPNTRTIRRLPSRMPSLNRPSNTSGPTRTTSYSHSHHSHGIATETAVNRKRKRGPSGNGNENLYSAGEPLSGTKVKGGLKRSKSAHATLGRSGSAMDVDEPSEGEPPRAAALHHKVLRMKSPEEEPIEEVDESEPVDSSDDFYLTTAPPRQLQRLLKDHLLRLYRLTGLEFDGAEDDLTKSDIVNALVQERKSLKALQPSSSPPSRRRTLPAGSSPSSTYTDGGNDAGAEESEETVEENDHKRARLIRRRATTHANLGLGHPASAKLIKSVSLNYVDGQPQAGPSTVRRARFASNLQSPHPSGAVAARSTRRTSGRSSPSSPNGPTNSSASTSQKVSPRHTRSRQISKAAPNRTGKGKHVEFSEADAEDGGTTTEEESDAVTADEGTDEDWQQQSEEQDMDQTPTRRKRTLSVSTPAPLKRSSSLRRHETAPLTRSESKARLFSPKKLRKLPSRMNVCDPNDQPTTTTRTELPKAKLVARTISFTRTSLPRKAKPGGSLKEASSSEDTDGLTESDKAVAEEPTADGEDEDQLAGDAEEDQNDSTDASDFAEDDVFTESRSKSKKSCRPAKPIPVVESDESDLTELSEEEQPPVEDAEPAEEDEAEDDEPAEDEDDDDDDFGSQAEESPDPDETPKATRTLKARSPRTTVPARPVTITRSRSRTNLATLATKSRPRRTAKAAEPEAMSSEELDEETEEQEQEQEEVAGDEEGSERDQEEVDAEENEDEVEAADEEEETAEDEDVTLETGSEAELAEMDVEPRVLRNGKVVGEVSEAVEDEDDEEIDQIDEDEDEEGTAEDEENAEEETAEEVEAEDDEEAEAEAMDEDLEDVADDDDMEEDFDLSEATVKTLTRLRRDDLVRLCETRELEAEGTKHQLAESLLQWRDQQAEAPSSSANPSSYASTVKAPSTSKPNNSGSPVLLRTDRVHVLQPRTPDPDPDGQEIVLIGSKGRDREPHGDELELDLESLGLEDREIPAEKLTKLEKIGSGGFKDVYIGKLRGRKVAIAEFRGHLGPMDVKELKLLRDFNHPNVVRFLGVSIPENTRETPVMMVSELCANGDLFDYIRNVPPPSLRKVLNLMLDVARGIDYLHNIHKPSVIHRDCKSSNILITSKVTAKIADFGLAKVKQSTRSMVKSLVGTVNWQAPELWHAHPKYDHKVDVFSCAMVFWEVLQWHLPAKKYPWEGMNEHAIYEEVGAKKHRPSITGLRKQWCPEIVELVEAMWSQDPKERPPISDVVEELETMVRNL